MIFALAASVFSEYQQRSKSSRLSQTADCRKASGSSIERIRLQLLAPKAGIRAATGCQSSSQRSARNGVTCQSMVQTSRIAARLGPDLGPDGPRPLLRLALVLGLRA